MNLKNAWKLLPLSGVAALSLLASCSQVDGAELLKGLILTEDGATVTADFDVPDTVQEQNVTWTSSNEEVIKFYQKDGDTWAGAIRSNESHSTTITATIGSDTKDYTITVNPVSVYEIAESYKFEQAGTQVANIEINLPSTYTYEYTTGALAEPQKYESSITWSSSNADLVTVSGDKAVVGAAANRTNVNLYATFTYNSRTSRYPYKLIVFKTYSQAEIFEEWYNEPSNGITYDIEGYVSYVTNDYSEQYKNLTYMFITNSDLTGGYMFYRPAMTQELFDQLTPGTPVKVSAMTTTYGGDSNGQLVQGAAGAVVTIDDSRTSIAANTIPTIAIDSEAAVNSDALLHKENSHVSLTGWKVKSKGTASATGTSSTQTALTLEKNGTEIKVAINKSVTPLDGAVATSVFSTLETISANDIVDITGYLSYYNGYQIFVDSATSIVKATTESTVSETLAAVPAAKTALDAAIKATNINKTHSEAATFTLPATQGDFNVTYSLGGAYDNISVANNVVTVTPSANEGKVVLIAKLNYADGEATKTVSLKYSFTIESNVPLVLEAGEHTESLSFDAYTKSGYNNLEEEDAPNFGLSKFIKVASIKNDGRYVSSVNVSTADSVTTKLLYLYAPNAEGKTVGSQLSFNFAYEGYTVTVTSVKITYSAANYSNGLVFTGGEEVVADSDTNADDLISVYNMTDVSSFSINATSSNIRIASLEFTYNVVVNAAE